jgi:hypothetical protein
MNIARGLFRVWALASAAWILMWLAGYLGFIDSPFPVGLYYPWAAWDWMTFKPLPERYVYVPEDAPKPKGTEAAKDPNGLSALTWEDEEYDRTMPTDNSIEIHHLANAEFVMPQTDSRSSRRNESWSCGCLLD